MLEAEGAGEAASKPDRVRLEGPGVAQSLCSLLTGRGLRLRFWITCGEAAVMKAGGGSEVRTGVEAAGAGALQLNRSGGWRAALDPLEF